MNRLELKSECARVRVMFEGPLGVFRMLSNLTPRFDKALWWYMDRLGPSQGMQTSLVRKALAKSFNFYNPFIPKRDLVQQQTTITSEIELVSDAFFEKGLIISYMGVHPFNFDVAHINDDVLMVYALTDKNSLEIPFDHTKSLAEFRLDTQRMPFDFAGMRIVKKDYPSDDVFVKVRRDKFVTMDKYYLISRLAFDTTFVDIDDIVSVPTMQVFDAARFRKVFDFLKIDVDLFISRIYSRYFDESMNREKHLDLLKPCFNSLFPEARLKALETILHLGGNKENFIACLCPEKIDGSSSLVLPELNSGFDF